jgi:hypothetical protein
MAPASGSGRLVSRRTILVLWILSLLPAALFLGLVLRSDARKAEFLERARGRAAGTVIRLVEERGKHLKYRPIVAFTTADGRRVEFRSIYADYHSFGEKHYPLGGSVSVLYVPEEPARAEVDEPALHAKDAGPFVIGSGVYAAFMTLVFGLLALSRPKGDGRAGKPAPPPAEPLAPS